MSLISIGNMEDAKNHLMISLNQGEIFSAYIRKAVADMLKTLLFEEEGVTLPWLDRLCTSFNQ